MVCLIEKEVNLSFKAKSQMDEMIIKQQCHLQRFFFIFPMQWKKKKQYWQLICMILLALFKLQYCILKISIPIMCFILLSTQPLIEMDRDEQRFSWNNLQLGFV